MTNWKEIRNEWETSKITLSALSEKYSVKLGTLKSRKSREDWSRDGPAKRDATKPEKVASKNKRDATRKKGAPKGNQNAAGNNGGAPKRNQNAVTHGLFSKFLPDETLEIMESLNERSPADLIWDQIQIQYAAIIRAQKIMFVENKDDLAKEQSQAGFGDSGADKWDIQFAWDRHATFLTAQTRAMGEFRSLIRQFDEMANIEDERRLKLEGMRLNITKTKAEIEKISGDNDSGPIEILIKRKGERA